MPEKFRIIHDDDPMDPLESETAVKIVAIHPRYRFGNAGVGGKGLNGIGEWNSYVRSNHHDLVWAQAHGLLRKIYLYDHSGLILKLDSPQGFPDIQWDVSEIGFIWMSRQAVLETYEVQKVRQCSVDKAKALIQAVFDSYNAYIQGDCWLLESLTADGDWMPELSGTFNEVTAEKARLEAQE